MEGKRSRMNSSENVDRSMSLLDDIGSMNAINALPDTVALHYYEKKIQESDTADEIHVALNEASDGMDQFWVDMLKIVAFHRCKTLDLLTEANQFRDSVTYEGYKRIR